MWAPHIHPDESIVHTARLFKSLLFVLYYSMCVRVCVFSTQMVLIGVTGFHLCEF